MLLNVNLCFRMLNILLLFPLQVLIIKYFDNHINFLSIQSLIHFKVKQEYQFPDALVPHKNYLSLVWIQSEFKY